ncbi:hypothetical protein GGR21_002716 [Dysgonomonas hofstadii]|uniref:DUF438 domain-containing protein n=1 Tax=Dysgonomonas hofstadii TaxID=637886 RepID=A0A840CY12_9BACT|nr:DUF438 domain-containing protein [Dysgonomonas hofstadii]MBB4036803.1 hypothetical protein [Dysgonomonas hofstadii]
MSEIINNSQHRRDLLKHLILQLHKGEAPDVVKSRLVELLRTIPYNEVVIVEQELIAEGLPEEEVLRFCDIHTAVLDGSIDTSAQKGVPAGHPVDTLKKENIELTKVIAQIREMFSQLKDIESQGVKKYLINLKGLLNQLSDVDKHYRRKEYLLFPFLEKHGITGPPKVMWGKHDETRELLKAAHEAINVNNEVTADELRTAIAYAIQPALSAVEGMIMKEEEILLPMTMDTLTEDEWLQIYKQSPEIGFCIYDPKNEWHIDDTTVSDVEYMNGTGRIVLPTGSFSIEELSTFFKYLPMDITFVDKDDKVRFFSLGEHRIFDRNRAIIGRDVQLCHPPGSVHIVEQILSDFKSGKESKAAFWINFKGMFVYIEYIALRNGKGEYLGVIECTQDLTKYRQLEGEQRLLSYSK